jgi:hypothetical protein
MVVIGTIAGAALTSADVSRFLETKNSPTLDAEF